MAFQTRDFLSILAGMINRLRATQTLLTDFNIGSVTRALLEAPAIEVEALYVQYVNGLLDAIPSAVYLGFDFDRLPAKFAGGQVEFVGEDGRVDDVQIPSGTQVRVPGTSLVYTTQVDATLLVADDSVLVSVIAIAAGAEYNTLPLTVVELVTPITGIDSITNPQAFTSGEDEETDGQRLSRFLEYIDSLTRATPAALRYAAYGSYLSDGTQVTEYVSKVGIDEDVPGRVYVWLYGSSGPLSDELLDLVQDRLDGYLDEGGSAVPGYRAAGVQVLARRMTTMAVDVTVTVHPLAGRTLDSVMQTGIASAIGTYLAAVEPGEVVSVSLLISQMLQVDGVESVDLYEPLSNVAVPFYNMPVPGTVVIQ